MAIFLDSNILLRHIANDHAEHSLAARSLIEDIESGHRSVWTTDLVIAEVVWVLTSPRLFAMSREDVRDVVLPILALSAFHLPGKQTYARVFEIFVDTGIDFIDAFHAARIESLRPPELYSFDRHYDRVPTVTRLEP